MRIHISKFFFHNIYFFISFLKHLLDEIIDLFAPSSGFAALHEMQELRLGGEAPVGGGKLKGPKEVVDLLKVGPHSEDLVDKIIDALDAVEVEPVLDDGVLADGDALLVDLAEAPLQNERLDGLKGGVSVGDIGLNETQHTNGGLVELDKDAVVDLTEAEELHDLLGLGVDADDTADTNDKGELGLLRDEEPTLVLGLPTSHNGSPLGSGVLGGVLCAVGGELLLVSAVHLLGGLGGDLGISGNLGLSGLLLQNGFRSLGHCLRQQ